MKKEVKFLSADGQAVRLEIEIRTKDDTAQDWDTLKEVENPRVLSITGDCGNGCGQIVDSFVPTPTQKLLVDFWHENHLNDLSAGTKKQTEYLREAGVFADSWEYDRAVSVLHDADLLCDRGYIYGHGWLYRSFDEDELNRIVKAVEQEEADRLAAKSKEYEGIDIWDDEDLDRLCGIVEERLPDAESPTAVIALLRHTDTQLADIDTVECHDDCCYSVGGTWYYCGTQCQLEDIADSLLTREDWVAAVDEDWTDLSFHDWKQEVIDMDLGNVLNSYDSTVSEYNVGGDDFLVCRQ